MTDYIIHGQTLTDIADAIRAKNPDVTGLVDPSDMAQDILDISGGTPVVLGTQWVRDYDFTESTDDKITSVPSYRDNAGFIQGEGIVWYNYYSFAQPNYKFNQKYNYEVTFKFTLKSGESAFSHSGNCWSIYNAVQFYILSDGQVGYSNSSTDNGRTQHTIEEFAGHELKLTMTKSQSNYNWNIVLSCEDLNYSQYVGGLSNDNQYSNHFQFGRYGNGESFEKWCLKYIKIKQIYGDGSDRILEDRTITSNGTFYPSSGYYGMEQVTVSVSEPTEKVVMHSDFTQSNTDLQTGMIEFSGNCTYDSTNKKLGMNYSDHRGYANFNYIINQDINYNYKIEIELDEVTEGTRATDKYLFAFYLNPNSQSGAELRLYWNNTGGYWSLRHSSGTYNYTNETNIHCFDNSITTFTFERRTNSTIYDVYIQNDNFNNGEKKLLHDVGDWVTRYLRIGAQGNNNGFENITINDVKITRVLYQAPRLLNITSEEPNNE